MTSCPVAVSRSDDVCVKPYCGEYGKLHWNKKLCWRYRIRHTCLPFLFLFPSRNVNSYSLITQTRPAQVYWVLLVPRDVRRISDVESQSSVYYGLISVAVYTLYEWVARVQIKRKTSYSLIIDFFYQRTRRNRRLVRNKE